MQKSTGAERIRAFISLDPGQRTGVAIWRTGEGRIGKPPHLVALWRVIKELQSKPWEYRCYLLGSMLDNVLSNPAYEWSGVYCELPAFFESAKGMAAAGRGDIVKLSYLVGLYAGICHSRKVHFGTVPVNDWKGQLPKSVIKKRILKRFGVAACAYFKGDIWDAVGIGLYVKGINFQT